MSLEEIERLQRENEELEVELAKLRRAELEMEEELDNQDRAFEMERASLESQFQEGSYAPETDEVLQLRESIAQAQKNLELVENSISEMNMEIKAVQDSINGASDPTDKVSINQKIHDTQHNIQKFREISETTENECISLLLQSYLGNNDSQEARKDRLNELMDLEELRLRESHLAFLKSLETPESEANAATGFPARQTLRKIAEKVDTLVESKAVLMKLKCEVAELDRRLQSRDFGVTTNDEFAKQKQLIDNYQKKSDTLKETLTDLENASDASLGSMQSAFDLLNENKREFIEQQIEYFDKRLDTISVQLEILKIRAETSAEKPPKSIKKYIALKTSIDELGDVIKNTLNRANVVNKKLEDEISMYKKHIEDKCADEELQQQMAEMNARLEREAREKRQDVKKDRDAINRLCDKLRIAHVGDGESAGRIVGRINERMDALKKPMTVKEKRSEKLLTTRLQTAREENRIHKKRHENLTESVDMLRQQHLK